MEDLLAWLVAHDELRVVLLVASLAFAITLESLIPLFRFDYQKLRHVGFNLVFLLTSGMVSGLLAFVAFALLQVDRFEYGLFGLLTLPLWVEVVLSLMLLDFFAQYFIHVCLHKYKWLWKLHLVHHSDTTVDASTGTRHHPGDIAIRELLTLTLVFACGIRPEVYVLYRVITPFFAYFTHANISLPPKVDRALAWVIVTPHMHKFHHHFERPRTDTNFGNILSIWDRLGGTFVYDDPAKIQYGVDTVDGDQDLSLRYQYSLPWNAAIKTDY